MPENSLQTSGGKQLSDAKAFLSGSREFVDKKLDAFLPGAETPPEMLHQAMRYSVFAGGKRLRPALVLAAAQAVGGSRENAAPAACAVELIHTYSLIHDDLPAMDDDDLRRGRPTCHKVFGEAMAILAGDGLLTYAFEVLAQSPRAEAVAGLVSAVARGAGSQGMVGGQVLDLAAEGRPPTEAAVRAIHAWKTAALIAACCEVGALAGQASPAQCAALKTYGQNIGLAFQIIDDILDLTSSPEALGKTPGKDVRAGKATFPAVLGIEKARSEADRYSRCAFEALQPLGARAETLLALGRFVLERQS